MLALKRTDFALLIILSNKIFQNGQFLFKYKYMNIFII